MNDKLRAYLELIRVPNVSTAVADVVAGFLYVGGQIAAWPTALALGLTSASLYSAGMAMNDVCDVDEDARSRPDRPLPSGRVSRTAALTLIVVLVAVALVTTFLVSIRALVIAAILVIAICLYNVILKSTAAAPPLLGICRALNLALGMSIAPLDASPHQMAPLLLMWLYASSLTYFARREAHEVHPWRAMLGTVGICGATGGLLVFLWTTEPVHSGYIPLAMALAAWLGYGGIKAGVRGDRLLVGQMVSRFVGSIVLFDVCIVWAARGPVLALPITVMLVPTLILKRSFRMT